MAEFMDVMSKTTEGCIVYVSVAVANRMHAVNVIHE